MITWENFIQTNEFKNSVRISNADLWILQSSYNPSPGAPAVVNGSFVRAEPASNFKWFPYKGDPVTYDSGVFTLSTPGIWQIIVKIWFSNTQEADNASTIWLDFYNGSAWQGTASKIGGNPGLVTGITTDVKTFSVDFKVANTENDKFRLFWAKSQLNTQLIQEWTNISFKRIGDL